MHWEQTAAMQVVGEISSFKKQSVVSDKEVCFPQTFSISTAK